MLGDLTDEARRAVRAAEARARQGRIQRQAVARETGHSVEPAAEAQARMAERAELARVLTPPQLEEYLLRYSPEADRLRERLRGFDAAPEEFRALYRAADVRATGLDELAGQTDATSEKRRQELERKYDEALRTTMDAGRYALYKLNAEPGFQLARETVQELGAPAEAVIPVYQVNQATTDQRRRIFNDPSLTPEQRSQQLAAVQQQRLETLRQLLGDEAFKLWQLSPGSE